MMKISRNKDDDEMAKYGKGSLKFPRKVANDNRSGAPGPYT